MSEHSWQALEAHPLWATFKAWYEADAEPVPLAWAWRAWLAGHTEGARSEARWAAEMMKELAAKRATQ